MNALTLTLQKNKEKYLQERKRYYVLIQYYMHQENDILYSFRVARLDSFLDDCVKDKRTFARYEQMAYDNLEKSVRMVAKDFHVDILTRLVTTEEARTLYDLFGPPYLTQVYEFGVGKLGEIIDEFE